MSRRFFWIVGVTGLLLSAASCEKAQPQAKPHLPVVDVAIPVAKPVAGYEDFIGRTDAVSKVDIRARVSGYLVKVAFTDGDHVKQGQLLYEIDPRPFQAELDQALGAVELLEAEKKLLAIQVERYTKLAAKGAGSQQDLDEYIGKQAENVGAIKAAKANVEKAALNLDFTKITAPIDGKVGRTLITVGNLVNADATLLTTLVSIDPMYAYFSVEEPMLIEIRKSIRDGIYKGQATKRVPVRMGLADDTGKTFPLHGWLDFTNNTVDPQTGTIEVRGVFENPYQEPEKPALLMPGYFVRVRLEDSRPHETLLVTDRAIGTDQGDKFVYVVDDANKIVYHRVTLGQLFHGLRAIETGLKPGERVVVNGLQRIRPGIEVKPNVVEMTPAGDVAKVEKPKPKEEKKEGREKKGEELEKKTTESR